MTLAEFHHERTMRPCNGCGNVGVDTELNPNNNGLLVYCPYCASKRPWGSLLYLKQNERKRPARPLLPEGETLDSIWARFDDRCVMCSAPRTFLEQIGIGRQVHHVAPFAEEGHRGPLVPICTHCHAVANERQRIYWFIRRFVMDEHRSTGLHVSDDDAGIVTQIVRANGPQLKKQSATS